MVERVGTTFPKNSEYGPKEVHIFDSLVKQVDKHFKNDSNLVINTTWFGSQFGGEQWEKANNFDTTFNNLFLLSVIDPLYLSDEDLNILVKKYKVKNVYRIGMFEDSKYEWNFHALIGNSVMPNYTEEQVVMKDQPEHMYMLYQRKPKYHRIEITEILRQRNLLKYGVVTLGGPEPDTNWQGEHKEWEILTIEDYPENYLGAGDAKDAFGGVPDDLATVGRLDLWQNHFLNIISEAVFDEWEPLLVTEKMWKPTIGLRPYIVHGNPKTYAWMRKNGFKTFNNYWKHIDVENIGPHDAVWQVLEFLQTQNLSKMYLDMLSDLRYNKERLKEFSKEQEYKMENIFAN